ncbi:MAG: nucleotidyltransferase [Cocleimonas sp.]|nr:nucleotidyltransferase [Cocleimonas sp.]
MSNDNILMYMVENIELPDSAYEKAIKRYESLGKWFGRDDSQCCNNNVQVFAQGSFRLGTAIKPLSEDEEYDLDLACNLRSGITTNSATQKSLKDLIGYELELYRINKGIEKKLDEKHRCWRLEYADKLSFHMDIVPCIPESSTVRERLFESIQEASLESIDMALARDVSSLAVAITDDRCGQIEQRCGEYTQIVNNWLISNPEGYAQWFDSRMRVGVLNEELKYVTEDSQVDDIPLHGRKTPLQRAIQLLKRHRDVMFADTPSIPDNTDRKPISVIITTVAAESYQGDDSIGVVLNNALEKMKEFASSGSYILPNPVNPEENFADRWSMDRYSHLNLRDNYVSWVDAAIRDFSDMRSIDDAELLMESVSQNMSLTVSQNNMRDVLGKSSAVTSSSSVVPIETAWKNTEEFIEHKYPISIEYNIRIDCEVSQHGFMPKALREMLAKHIPLMPDKKLLFKVQSTNVPRPYSIEWKVLNRGEVAQKRNCIRGQIAPDRGHGERKESTNFKGEHVVDCYIIKNGIVVARDQINVPIRS